jgi:hypothetical protein
MLATVRSGLNLNRAYKTLTAFLVLLAFSPTASSLDNMVEWSRPTHYFPAPGQPLTDPLPEADILGYVIEYQECTGPIWSPTRTQILVYAPALTWKHVVSDGTIWCYRAAVELRSGVRSAWTPYVVAESPVGEPGRPMPPNNVRIAFLF